MNNPLLSDLSKFLPEHTMWEYNQHLQFFSALHNSKYENNLLRALLLFKISRPQEGLTYLQLCSTQEAVVRALLQKFSHITQNNATPVTLIPGSLKSLQLLGLAIEADTFSATQDSINFLTKMTEALQIDTTPLHLSVEYGLLSTFSSLIELYNINSKDYLGWTPLHWAAWLNKKDILSTLITCEAKVNMRGNHNESSLYLAAFNGHKESVEVLLTNKAKTDIRSTLSNTAMHMASYNEHLDVISIMLEHGADIDIRSHVRYNTPLHVAAWHGKCKSATYLIENGCSIDARMVNGGTPLHRAALNGRTEIIVLLLDNGADINAVDNLGRTPISCAKQNQHWNSYKLLLSRKT